MDEDIERLEQKLEKIDVIVDELAREIAALKLSRATQLDIRQNKIVAPIVEPAPSESVLFTPVSPEPVSSEHIPPEHVPREPRPREPGFLSTLVAELLKKLFLFVLSPVLEQLAVPLQKVSDLYHHYRAEGKAPVFLMTAVGLIALVSGFGYGLQYAFANVLSDTFKVGLGFLIGTSVVALGSYISVKKAGFQEYGASVIGLGLIFNYLSAYFIGDYFNLIGELATFLVLILITVSSYLLALRFETRVVAAITLVGGILSPVVLGDISLVDTSYVVYLLALVALNLHLAHKIRWSSLAQAAFLLSLGMLEYSSYGEVVGGTSALLLHVVFFNLFAYYWSFDGLALKSKLERLDLGFLTSNLFYLLYAVLSAEVNAYVCAAILILNAGLIVLFIRSLRLASSVAGPMYVLMAASLVAASVFVLAPLSIMGSLWAIEGMALVYIGFTYKQLVIRIEGYAIFAVATLCLVWQIAFVQSLDAYTGGLLPWFDLVVLGGLFFAGFKLIGKYLAEAGRFEFYIDKTLKEAFSLWGVAAQLVVAFIIFNSALFVLAVLPLLWSFFLAARYQLKLAMFTGCLLYAAFLLQILLGMYDVDSRLISAQAWLSWVALVELIVIGWGLQWLFERNSLKGVAVTFAKFLRTLISLVPVMIMLSAASAILQFDPLNVWQIWTDLALAIVLLLLAKVLNARVAGACDALQLRIIEETLSASCAILMLYSLSIYSFKWMLVASIVPFAVLLYRGLVMRLLVTEVLAWASLALLFIAVRNGFAETGSMRFSHQALVTQCALATLLIAAWLGQWIYEKSGREGWLLKLGRLTRIISYLVIPLLFLPTVRRLAPDFLPLALWGSVLVSWLMHRYLQIVALLVEVHLLAVIAGLSVVGASVSALVGGDSTAALAGVGFSTVVLLLMHRVEQSMQDTAGSPYRRILWTSVHYSAFCLASLVYGFSQQVSLVFLFVGFFYVVMCYWPPVRSVTRPSLTLNYLMACLALSVGSILVFFGGVGSEMFGLFNIIAVTCLGVVVHSAVPFNRLLRLKYDGESVQLLLFHSVVVVCYLGAINALFEFWSVFTTIALLLHAVVVLFMTLKPRYKTLVKLSVFLYAATAAKLLLLDLNEFGALVRVAALMGIGAILMIAAYFYQKVSSNAPAETVEDV